MSYNALEKELIVSLDAAINTEALRIVDDASPYLLALEAAFPFTSNRLDWRRVRDAIEGGELGLPDAANVFTKFIGSSVSASDMDEVVAVVGDGPIAFAVTGTLRDVMPHMPHIVDFPQHSYVFPYPHATWCASLTFEGWMYFGHSPRI